MNLPKSLAHCKAIFFDKLALDFTDFYKAAESAEYDACSFKLGNNITIYRAAKTTPTKVGAFVTIWKRNELGITVPHNVSDSFDFMFIYCKLNDLDGLFVFPKFLLLEHGIISGTNSVGKRGIRVYPSWEMNLNKQAQKTQQWQLNYFVDFSDEARLSLFNMLIKK